MMGSEENTEVTGARSKEASLAETLSHPVRQQVVGYLRNRDGAGVRLLAIRVTKREADRRGIPTAEIGHDQLRHDLEEDHLPLLVDAGILTYNRDTEWVELNGHDDEILDRVLDELTDPGS